MDKDNFETVLPKIAAIPLFSSFNIKNKDDVEILQSVYEIITIKKFKKGDVIYGYSGHRCTFWIIGIDYGTSFSDMRTILWTNLDTGSDFANQTITLDSGARNFDTIRIYYKLVKGAPETIYMDYQVSNLTSDADSGRMAIMTYTNSKNYVRSICFNGTNYDKLIIDSATVVGASGTDNSLLIPTYVAGIR